AETSSSNFLIWILVQQATLNSASHAESCYRAALIQPEVPMFYLPLPSDQADRLASEPNTDFF
ncbi:unnamed protein product, partial [marine sediment metagenome]